MKRLVDIAKHSFPMVVGECEAVKGALNGKKDIMSCYALPERKEAAYLSHFSPIYGSVAEIVVQAMHVRQIVFGQKMLRVATH